jgi:hypothetical protein
MSRIVESQQIEVDHANANEGAVSDRSRQSGIEDGTPPDTLRKTLETVQADAAYFTAMDGKRTMLAVFDLKAVSDISRVAEPLFMRLNASVEFIPRMNAEELKTGLSALG